MSTVYSVRVNPGRTLDMRRPEHRELYDKIRRDHNSSVADPDDHLPKSSSEGFLQRSGLPGFGHVRTILPHAAKHGFDSMLVDEGTQGESLAVHEPQKRVRVIRKETASMPWPAEDFRDKHNKKLTPTQADKAAKIANAVLERTGDEGKAIRVANSRATASIRESALAACLDAELAADKWWEGLSDKEKKAYVAAHPKSKYAKYEARSDKQTYKKYGAAVKKLVDKYAQHSVPSTPEQSGSIEYRARVRHAGAAYPVQVNHDFHHAVHIGGAFPKEHKDAFLEEYRKIPRPRQIRLSTQTAGVRTADLMHQVRLGSNYNVYGLTPSGPVR